MTQKKKYVCLYCKAETNGNLCCQACNFKLSTGHALQPLTSPTSEGKGKGGHGLP